jgi:hypothetical protein
MSGPHDFAVRATHHSSVDGFASIASSPPFVTIAKRPSVGRTARTLPVIWGGDQLRQIGTTGKSPGTFRQFVKRMLSFRGASATSEPGIHGAASMLGEMDSGPAPFAQNSLAILSRRRIPE